MPETHSGWTVIPGEVQCVESDISQFYRNPQQEFQNGNSLEFSTKVYMYMYMYLYIYINGLV